VIDRRMFIAGTEAVLLAEPVAAEGQLERTVPKIGVLSFGHSPLGTTPSDPNEGFRQGMRDLGYVEGRNVIIEWRYAETRTDRLGQLAVELVRQKVDVLFVGGPGVLRAAMKATDTIPIVAVSGSDAVREGWVQSLTRPGGNATGLTVTYPEIAAKRLQVLKEAVPGILRVVIIANPDEGSILPETWRAMEIGARSLGLELRVLEVRGPNDIARAFTTAKQWRAHALQTTDTTLIFFHRVRLAELAIGGRLPSMGEFRPLAEAGFLLTYGADLYDLSRRAATQVDKILKGGETR